MELSQLSVSAYLERIAGPDEAPGGLAASALSAALGAALLEKPLHEPPEGVSPNAAATEAEILRALRRRLLDLAAAPAPDLEPAQALAGYRAERKLIDLAIQGLTQIQKTLDFGSTTQLAEVEAGWRLLAAALESGIAGAEERLKRLEASFADAEGLALARQAQQGRELSMRAQGALSWRRGKV